MKRWVVAMLVVTLAACASPAPSAEKPGPSAATSVTPSATPTTEWYDAPAAPDIFGPPGNAGWVTPRWSMAIDPTWEPQSVPTTWVIAAPQGAALLTISTNESPTTLTTVEARNSAEAIVASQFDSLDVTQRGVFRGPAANRVGWLTYTFELNGVVRAGRSWVIATELSFVTATLVVESRQALPAAVATVEAYLVTLRRAEEDS